MPQLMTRTRSFVSSTFFGYLHQASVMLVGLWLTPFYLRTLGQHGYGVWLVGLQVLSIILLMDFGVVAILPRDIAQLSGKIKAEGAGWEPLIELVSKTTKIVRFQTLVVSGAALCAYFLWPGITPEIRGPVAVAICAFCLSFPLRIYPAVLEGLQDIRFLSQLRIVLWVGVTAITVAFLTLNWRLYALAVGWAVNILAFQMIGLIRLRICYPRLLVIHHWLDKGLLGWRDISRGAWVSVGQISQILLDGTYIIALARIVGPAAVFTYSCTSKMITALASQPQLFVLTALPGLSQMKTSVSTDRIRLVTTVLAEGMLILGGAIVCVSFSVNEYFVRAWVGPKLFGGTLLTALILTGMLMRQLDIAFSQALFAMSHERALAVKGLVDGVVTTLSAFLAIHWFGLYGAAMAQIAGVLLVSLPTDVRLFCREFDVGAWKALSPYVPYLWRLVLTCAAGMLLARDLNPHSYLAIAQIAIVVLALYFALVFHHIRHTPLRGYVQAAWDHVWALVMNPRVRVANG